MSEVARVRETGTRLAERQNEREERAHRLYRLPCYVS